MSPSVIVSYRLCPPEGTSASNLSPSTTLDFRVEGAITDHAEYYKALTFAVAETKSRTGKDLTAWRDVVGIKELNKEGRSQIGGAEIEGEEEEEED